jgi:hypothetical protein
MGGAQKGSASHKKVGFWGSKERRSRKNQIQTQVFKLACTKSATPKKFMRYLKKSGRAWHFS